MKPKHLPKIFSSFPSLRFPFFWNEDLEEWNFPTEQSSGLSIYEDDRSIFVEAAVPGMKIENIEILLDQGILFVKAEKEEDKKEGLKFHRKSISSYSYRIAIPGEIDESKEPEATYKDGIMKLKFAKLKSTKPKKITIKES